MKPHVTGIPSVPSVLPFGFSHFFAFVRMPHDFCLRLSQAYGEIVHFKIWWQDFVLINDPDLVREVLITQQHNFPKGETALSLKHYFGNGLLTDDPPTHLTQRRITQPAFSPQRVAAYAPIVRVYGERLSHQWQDGQVIDIARDMRLVTLTIVVKALFNLDLDPHNDTFTEALYTALDWSERVWLPPLVVDWLDRLPLSSTRRFRAARRYLDTYFFTLIHTRRATGNDQGDLLSALLAAQRQNATEMSDRQIRDHLITFFLGGHETTALSLTWAWYLLAQHPDVAAKLHAELDAVLEGRAPALDDLTRLPYLDMVINETLRLYPPAHTFARQSRHACRVGPYLIPAKTMILISPYVLHRQPRYWSHPERFDPDRWIPDAKGNLPKRAYLPFGMGARQCIGKGFSLMEAALLLAQLAQKWEAAPVPGFQIAPRPLVTLRPRNGFHVQLKQRVVAPAAPQAVP